MSNTFYFNNKYNDERVKLFQTILNLTRTFLTKTYILQNMEWYIKNRWWIWAITAVYLAYRIYLSITY